MRQKLLPWLNLALAALLIGLGVWYLADKVSLAEIIEALRLAKPGYILLGLVIMVVTIMLKAWRWRYLLINPADPTRLPYLPLFWALSLGQYVNLIVPFLRLGELARVYALHQQTGVSKGRSLGTLVVEKVLDLIFFALTIILILPFVILPDFVGDPGLMVGAVALVLLLLLYLLAYQTGPITRILRSLSDKVPLRLWKRLLQLGASGLAGLAALRNPRLSFLLVVLTAVIAFLSALLPYILFPAFDIPLSFVQAALLHIVVSVASVPPSTPAKIGVFNGVVAFMLLGLGVENEAAIVSYAIVFHLVVIVPQIAFGSIAAARTNWRWQKTAEQQVIA